MTCSFPFSNRYTDVHFRSRYLRRFGFQRRRPRTSPAKASSMGFSSMEPTAERSAHAARGGRGQRRGNAGQQHFDGLAARPGCTPLPLPLNVTDYNSKIGWNLGGYIQDEWKITNNLTLNTGLRFDQLYQFVDANQFSLSHCARLQAFEDTSIHAGICALFHAAMQAQATPTNLALFNNTTQQPVIDANSPVLPERFALFRCRRGSEASPRPYRRRRCYLKLATDLLDDGQSVRRWC